MTIAAIPSGWTENPLGKVADVVRDSVLPHNIVPGTSYVGLEHIDGEGRFVGVQPVANGELASNKFSFSDQHILYGKLRPYLKKIARPSFSGVCSTDILPLRPLDEVDRGYLFHYLRQQHLIDLATTRSTGANLPRLSPKQLEVFPVAYPPLPEQRRIAAILDKADAIRRKREEGIRLTEELLRSTFLEMFGDPATNPKGWSVNSMNRIAKITGGFAFKSEWFADEGDRVIRISDIGDGKVDLSNAVSVDCDSYRISTAYQCVTDDILMALSGATTGKLGMVTDAESGSFVNQRIAIIRANNRVASPWLSQLLSNKRVLSLLLESAGGSAQANLSTKSLESLDIPVPPDNVLFEYAEVVKSANRAQSRRRIGSKDADNLFNSLVQRAFRGEL
ncbi:MAG: restriction endonuclease subunit S [Planctomycetia bacterium]|nr:restriction endonuclease subunit S [Planctomycetia bacterium]